MDKKNNVIKFFKKNFLPLINDEDENVLMGYFKKHRFKKKELIFVNGDKNTRHYFIESGLLRLFLINKSGKEFNILFAKENQIIGDLTTPEPTEFNLESIEASDVFSISEFDFQRLIDKLSLTHQATPETSLRKSFTLIQKRLVSILAYPAEKNYFDLKKNYPDLIKRLPQYHIASYLGISAEFLSKIISKNTKSTEKYLSS